MFSQGVQYCIFKHFACSLAYLNSVIVQLQVFLYWEDVPFNWGCWVWSHKTLVILWDRFSLVLYIIFYVGLMQELWRWKFTEMTIVSQGFDMLRVFTALHWWSLDAIFFFASVGLMASSAIVMYSVLLGSASVKDKGYAKQFLDRHLLPSMETSQKVLVHLTCSAASPGLHVAS